MPIPTLIILSFTLFFLWKEYNFRAFLHPATIFHVIWILSAISYLIVVNLMERQIVILFIDEYFVNELLTFVCFTSIAVSINVYFSKGRMKSRIVQWRYPLVINDLIRILILVIFVVSFARVLLVGSLNVVQIRNAFGEETDRLMGGGLIGVGAFLINLILIFNQPLLTYSGYALSRLAKEKYFSNDRKLKKNIILLYLPIISGLFNAFLTGGRSAFLRVFILFAIGYALALFQREDLKLKKFRRGIVYLVLFFLLFSFYSTFIDESRRYAGNPNYVSDYASYPLLKPFSGIINYLVCHYPGYCLDRKYVVTEAPEFGRWTLQGITHLEIPFLSQLLFPISINSLINGSGQFEVSKRDMGNYAGWIRTTSTVFLLIYDDYCYFFSFIIIFLFVSISQYLFIRLFSKKSTRFLSIFPYTIFYLLWVNSIFTHHLTGNWLTNIFLCYLVFDWISHKKKHTSMRAFKPLRRSSENI
jgi:oligosaccharide repeat unit polymerase